MQKNEFNQFAEMWAQSWEQAGAVISPGAVEMAFDALQDYDLQDIRRSLTVHMRDPERGRFAPKVADVVAVLGAVDPDAWPSPDEAWGIAVRTFDEADTCIVCDEIMTARESCEPVMKLGDEVGARMTFRDVFDRQRRAAIANGRKPRWWMTPGYDRTLRAQRLAEAVALKRIPPSVLVGLEAPLPDNPVVAMRRIAAAKDGAIKAQAEEAIAKLDAIRKALQSGLDRDAEAAVARRQAVREQAEARREAVVTRAMQRLARDDAA